MVLRIGAAHDTRLDPRRLQGYGPASPRAIVFLFLRCCRLQIGRPLAPFPLPLYPEVVYQRAALTITITWPTFFTMVRKLLHLYQQCF
jgi:hypothetical protein